MVQWLLKRNDRVKYSGPVVMKYEKGVGKVIAVRMVEPVVSSPGLCGGTTTQMVLVRWEKSRRKIEYHRSLLRLTKVK